MKFSFFLSILDLFFASAVFAETTIAPPAVTYKTISTSYVNNNRDIVRATFHNTPINLVDTNVINDIYDFLVAQNTSSHRPKVVIFSSAIPGFFLSHLDIHLITTQQRNPNAYETYTRYVSLLTLLAELPIIFIGESNGITSSAGNELFMHMDMRFAGPDGKFGAIEAGINLFHQGGFRQLSQLIGAGQTTYYLLTGYTADAQTAARIGWVNEAFESVQALQQNSDAVATRIALFPIGGLVAAKVAIHDTGIGGPLQAFEVALTNTLANTTISQDALQKYLRLSFNETGGIDDHQTSSIGELYE